MCQFLCLDYQCCDLCQTIQICRSKALLHKSVIEPIHKPLKLLASIEIFPILVWVPSYRFTGFNTNSPIKAGSTEIPCLTIHVKA